MPALVPRQTCCERASNPFEMGWRICTKPATVLRADKPYCTIHDPDRIAAKREKKSAAFVAEMARCRRVAEKTIARERITEAAIREVDSFQDWQPVIDAVRAWQALP